MERDLELETWRLHWQAEPAVADLRQRVERETRLMRRGVLVEIAVTAVFGGGSTAWAAVSRTMDALVFAAGIWAFIAIAWTFAVLLRRGAWMSATATTSAFLELSILRCRRRREAIVAQAGLYLMILVFDFAWIYFHEPATARSDLLTFLTGARFLWVWAITLALGGAALWQRRRLALELRNLMDLRGQIESVNA